MGWWSVITEFLRKSQSLPEPDKRTLGDKVRAAVAGQIIDWLYFVLAVFTYFYIFAAAFLFFTRRGGYFLVLTRLLDALSEPYLGSVGIYVILKEIRKRRFGEQSKHWGEFFVFLWISLLVIAVPFIIFSESYVFDEVAGLIVTMGLGVFVIYLAGLINRP